MARLTGQVAFITGAARGQGRAHAVRLAEDGADIIAVDICAPLTSTAYDMSTEEDLAETARLVEKHGSRVVTAVADVRDPAALKTALEQGVAELGGLDIVIANAGIAAFSLGHLIDEQEWAETIDINLSGVWRTVKLAVPHLLERGKGSIILTCSCASVQGPSHLAHYTAAKHGVLGLVKTFANELGPHNIRVNGLMPTQVDTPMIMHEGVYSLFRPDLEHPTKDDFVGPSQAGNVLPVPWVEPVDVANAAAFLCSDEARYITGVALPIDAGTLIKR
ncbi:mycofactocin-coupled SDR family oxidoreductase [Rhodococcus sp. T2V]|uniref:mycofactocin-coupled SDR family oxidoreductase n=1 Tax=Rhodococcus sp. T2V TaxID=3034164 RepID=UPI0023E28711|nr:mycofactocin-coupled SDR family oxidoreductase [Rhodococcus sp. T2V]MDF3313541.1 mycofactocin-coupled SDR family oxidoreductase [Rhodococcus sp. T2V]